MPAPGLGGFTPSQTAAGPHYKAGGCLEAGLGILEKKKFLAIAGVRSPGGTNGEDKKYVQNFSGNS